MMPRVFVTEAIATGQSIVVDGEDGHHFARVLRAKPGEPMVAVSRGDAFLGSVEQVDAGSGRVTIRIQEPLPSHEPSVDVVVVQCLAKGDKIEEVLQKCTEIGAAGFIMVESDRSVVRLDGHRLSQKLERWQKQVKEAASQSQRDTIPSVDTAPSWTAVQQLLKRVQVQACFMLDENEDHRALGQALRAHFAQPDKRLCFAVLVGPEGGWSDAERVLLQESLGAQRVTLGPRILRTETAGPTAVCAILYEYGDMGGR